MDVRSLGITTDGPGPRHQPQQSADGFVVNSDTTCSSTGGHAQLSPAGNRSTTAPAQSWQGRQGKGSILTACPSDQRMAQKESMAMHGVETSPGHNHLRHNRGVPLADSSGTTEDLLKDCMTYHIYHLINNQDRRMPYLRWNA